MGTGAGEYILVFDVGTGTSRVCLFDGGDGACVRSVSRPRRISAENPADPFLRVFDTDELWSDLCSMSRELLAGAGIAPGAVRAVTATAQRASDVFLDAKGHALYAGPNSDARGVYAEGTDAEGAEAELRGVTGQWPPVLSTLARLLWFRQEDPATFGRIRRALSLNDWILFKLTGEIVSDPTSCSTSFLLDVAHRQWSTRLLERFSLDASLLSPLVDACHVVGGLTAEATRETGLPEKTSVVVAGSDSHCGILGAGALDSGDVGIVAGTTTPVCLLLDHHIVERESRVWASCHLPPGQWVLEGNARWTGAIYQWLHDLWKEELLGDRAAGSCYERMEDKARRVPPGSGDTYTFFGPTVMDTRDFFVLRPGMILFPPPINPMVERPLTLGRIVRATLENIAYAIRGNLDLLRNDHPPVAPHAGPLHVTGGLSQCDLLLQILADVTGLPVAVPRVRNGSSLGAAICAAAGAGIHTDLRSAARAMVKASAFIEPIPDNASAYNSAYHRWMELYGTISEI